MLGMMTPITSPPAESAPSATAPISPVLPPPKIKRSPRFARATPI